jgi:zinc transporter ZupT
VPLLGWIVVFTAVGGIASAACAGLFLLLPEKTGLRMLPHFVSFATGALIGAALLGLLPEAMEAVGPAGAHGIGVALVVGLGVFFIIEKLVLWRHAHSHEHENSAAVSHDVTETSSHGVPASGHTDTLGETARHGEVRHVGASVAGAAVVAAEQRRAVAFAGGIGSGSAVSLGSVGSGSGVSVDSQGHDPSQTSDHGRTSDPSHTSDPSRMRDHHGHDHGGHDHTHGHDREGAAGVLVLIGDSIHNALDGILIAAAFLTNVPLGLVTTVAVAAHEIPHRVGDFAILLHAGMSRRRAMFLNMATGLASVLGGIVAYFGLSKAREALPYALALAAAGFLYIAVAGLIPGLHRRADPRTSLAQVLLIGLGVALIAWAESLTG